MKKVYILVASVVASVGVFFAGTASWAFTNQPKTPNCLK